jgi:hypothetical protein
MSVVDLASNIESSVLIVNFVLVDLSLKKTWWIITELSCRYLFLIPFPINFDSLADLKSCGFEIIRKANTNFRTVISVQNYGGHLCMYFDNSYLWNPERGGHNTIYRINADATVNRGSFSPSFKSTEVSSDRREIFSDYLTALPVHCKEKQIRKIFNAFFVLKVLTYLSNFDVKNIC